MANKELHIESNSPVFNGFFQVNNLKFTHSLYQGGFSPVVEREVFSRGQAVVVLLYDLALEKIVLVEQCRAGAVEYALQNSEVDQAWLLEPVAGMIDLGESPIEACIRESKEETGLSVSELEYISQFYPSPGACDEILHLYASNIDSQLVNSHAGLETEDEYIRVVVLSFAQARKMLERGQFNVATTYIAIQWLFYQKLALLENQ
ncbi:MAG: NUDIX domain-containing protein [Pseudomonadota bacterium]|nr:NUDIX domain-containing protein [Pseudomonadota bacterium]